jgi:hypothetical protein
MEFIQKHNFYKENAFGKRKLVASNVPLKISIDDNDIVGVQEVINERTRVAYKKICMINLVNYAQYNNQLIVNCAYSKVKIMLDSKSTQHVAIKGFR